MRLSGGRGNVLQLFLGASGGRLDGTLARMSTGGLSGWRHGSISVVLLLGATARLAAAQTLQFTEPAANALTALGATQNYTVGDDVRIAWQTDFEHTTLELWQGPLDDGSYVSRVLAGM